MSSPRWIDTTEGQAAAARLQGTAPVWQQPAPTTAQAIEDPARYGAQWHCLHDGCNYQVPAHSEAARRHPATHRPAKMSAAADRKRAEADEANRRIIKLAEWPCDCGVLMRPGEQHTCSRTPNTGTMPHEQAAARWRRDGLAEAIDDLSTP
jgi:hypothetical protein